MPGKNAHSLNFTDEHEGLIESLIVDTGKSRSEIVRLLIDTAIETHPYIGIPFIEAQKQGLEAQAAECAGKLSLLQQKAQESQGISPFASVQERREAARTARPVTKPPEGRDMVLHCLKWVDAPGRGGDSARDKLKTLIAENPAWLELVPVEHRPLITGGGPDD